MRNHTSADAAPPRAARAARRAAPNAALPAPERALALDAPPSLALLEAPCREDLIRARAYALYERNGRVDGRALEDWVAAEAELTAAEARVSDVDPARATPA